MNTIQTDSNGPCTHDTLMIDERPVKDVLVVKSGELSLHKSQFSGARVWLSGGLLACIVLMGLYFRGRKVRSHAYKMVGRDLHA